MKIEWASNFTPDGRRRTPPPSTIHGWLAKWRGTLSGNEVLRSRGMSEMRRAASQRQARKKYELKKAAKNGKSGLSLLSIFRSKRSGKNRLSGRSRTQSSRSRPQTTRRLTSSHKPGSKPASRNSSQKQLTPRPRPKAKRHGSSARRPVHGRS